MPSADAKGASAAPRASAVGKRSAGDFASAVATASSRSSGTSGRTRRRLGVASATMAAIAAVVVPRKGGAPATSS